MQDEFFRGIADAFGKALSLQQYQRCIDSDGVYVIVGDWKVTLEKNKVVVPEPPVQAPVKRKKKEAK